MSMVAIGETIFAAVEMPPAKLTSDSKTQWQPGIYIRPAAATEWSPWPGWAEALPGNCSPTVMCRIDDKGLAVGTTGGVYYWPEVTPTGQVITPPIKPDGGSPPGTLSPWRWG